MILLAALKLILFVIVLAVYFITTLPLLIPFYFRPSPTRVALNYLVHIYSRFVLFFLNVKVNWNLKSDLPRDGKLIVCNHLSYLDILILSSRIPSSFVTSTEMKETFGLGQICILAGCVFVNRKNKKNIHSEVKEITEALKEKINVIIFPEATSTNGEEVLRFRRPLFQSALDAKQNVSPITINYKKLNNEKVTRSNRDQIFWYGDMTFFSHFWKFLKIQKTVVEVTIEAEIPTTQHPDTISISSKSFEIIKNLYQPVLS